jgi:hypothetical protein
MKKYSGRNDEMPLYSMKVDLMGLSLVLRQKIQEKNTQTSSGEQVASLQIISWGTGDLFPPRTIPKCSF